MTSAVRELIRALEKVQDWDSTYVGDCIGRFEKQLSLHSDDYIPMRPIPISERLPKPYDPDSTRPHDCDPMGRCWCWDGLLCAWKLSNRLDLGHDTHWLPWWALPLPEVES